MSRRLEHLTLDNLSDLPVGCRACTFWEMDPVRRGRAALTGQGADEKESWVSSVLLEWGSCGRVAYVDGDPAGYVLYLSLIHISEPTRRTPISYAVFCLKKKKKTTLRATYTCI